MDIFNCFVIYNNNKPFKPKIYCALMAEHTKSLDAVTVIEFRDHGENSGFSRVYEGLLNFQEGDMINLIGSNAPVSQGNYVLRRKTIQNQMALNLDEPDSIYRYFIAEKLH